MCENTNSLKFGLQQSDDLINWNNVDKELPSDQSTSTIELPFEKEVLFFSVDQVCSLVEMESGLSGLVNALPVGDCPSHLTARTN